MVCHCLSTGLGGSDTLVSWLHLMTTGGCFHSSLHYRTGTHAFEQRRKASVTHHIMHDTRGRDMNRWQFHETCNAPNTDFRGKVLQNCTSQSQPHKLGVPSTQSLGQPIHRLCWLCLQGTHLTTALYQQGTSWFHWTCNRQSWNIRVKAALETDLETLYLFHELGILHYLATTHLNHSSCTWTVIDILSPPKWFSRSD